MKILLCAINTKYIHSNAAVRLLSLYARQKQQEEQLLPAEAYPEIMVAEYTINQSFDDVLSQIFLEHADAVLFSCYIWNWDFIRRLLRELPKVLPGTELWLGGPEVTFHAEDVLEEFPEVRGILRGEGEGTFQDLVQNYFGNSRKSLREIPGISFREQGKINTNAERELLEMDQVPFIYSEDNLREFEHKILYYESQRGCPFSCAYCLSAVDQRVRFRSLEKVYRELQFFLDAEVPQVKFVDRTFNIRRSHSENILAYLASHDNGITNFHFEVAGDYLSDREIELLNGMRPGQVQLEIGVQSSNPDTLRAVDRVTDLSRLEENVRSIQKTRNVHVHLDLIAGLPFENYNSFANSFNWVYGLHPDQLQLGFLKVLKGSPMEERADAFGIRYQSRPPYEVLATNWITYAELVRLKKVEAMLEIYYNSRQFTKTLAVLEGAFPTPFSMYEALADYYDEMGYFTQSPSRIYRYQVLLEFAVSRGNGVRELYQELLTYDLYLRENLKSRPDFAPDLAPYAEIIRGYGRQNSRHVDVFHYCVDAQNAEQICTRLEEPLFLLFDYEHRDPLDHNARVNRQKAMNPRHKSEERMRGNYEISKSMD